MGRIDENTTHNAKLGYYISNGSFGTYQEVHLYPCRGEKNLNGWDDYVYIGAEETSDPLRTRENRKWDAFEMNDLHQTETSNETEAPTGFTHRGTCVVYNNGETKDIKVYLGTGFQYKVVD